VKHLKMMATHNRDRENGDVYAWAHREPVLSFNNQRRLERPFDEDYVGWKNLQMRRPPNLNAKENRNGNKPLELISRLAGLLRVETGGMRPWEVLPAEICSAIPKPI